MAINHVVNTNSGVCSPLRGGGPAERATPAAPDRQPGVGTMPDAPVAGKEQIQLTPSSLSLRQLESNSNETPVNKEKVEALRKMIADGDYKVDSRRLAGNIIAHEQKLFEQG
jgi:flagellar biosynthesis anti-sigma factor FlgM